MNAALTRAPERHILTPGTLPALQPHDQVTLSWISGRWDVLGDALDGRYVLIVNPIDELYQVIDREQGWRGTLTSTEEDRYRGAFFDVDDPKSYADYILSELNDGRPLHSASIIPQQIERHWTSEIRGPVLDPEKLSDWASHRVWHWLQANGCRWLVGSSAVVRIKGHYIELNTWTIRNHHQSKTLWPRRLPEDFEPPQKHRRLRIRVPLSTIRKA